jgi:uncharacterized protein (TIGR02145 family)
MNKILIIFFYFTTLHFFSQEQLIRHNLIFGENELCIKYEILNSTNSKYDTKLIIKNKKGNPIFPNEIIGDIKSIKPGKNKQIICKFDTESKLNKNCIVELYIYPSKDSLINFNKNLNYGFIIDQDFEIYRTIKIGKQIWMAENLRRKEFNNYEKINFTEDLEEWTNSNPKTIYSLSSDTLIFKNASVFYPWNIVNDKRGICPFGWHIPKDSEWKLLSNELKNDNIVNKLIENNNKQLVNTNSDTTNTNVSGFTALPKGYINENGEHVDKNNSCYWWSNSVYYNDFSCYFTLDLKNQVHKNFNCSQKRGMSVRCVKD